MLSVLTQFLSNQLQYVMVDGSQSKLVNVVSGVPEGSLLDVQLFFLYTMELFSIVETSFMAMLMTTSEAVMSHPTLESSCYSP